MVDSLSTAAKLTNNVGITKELEKLNLTVQENPELSAGLTLFIKNVPDWLSKTPSDDIKSEINTKIGVINPLKTRIKKGDF